MSTIAPPCPPRTARPTRRAGVCHTLLGAYADQRELRREIVARTGAAGSTLVIDRLAVSASDERLVAHLAADEPRENARIVCALYLADGRSRRCRRLSEEDLVGDPLAVIDGSPLNGSARASSDRCGPLLDRRGYTYCLAAVSDGRSIPELRWQRAEQLSGNDRTETVSLRAAVASLESYEPARALTIRALANDRRDPRVSTAVLRGELARLTRSHVVLNRALREAVLSAVARQGLSMSEIAMRCGRIKRDGRGHVAGETSWLARRIGAMPEGGGHAPTPWIHSETLALIARQGLGVAPHEVELG